MAHTFEGDRLLTPKEAAALIRVEPQTLARWARAGRLSFATTGGGHRRYWQSDVEEMAGVRGQRTGRH
jgi:excisionase family DNA binding protein